MEIQVYNLRLNFPINSPNRLPRHERFPIAVDPGQRVRRDQEEPPRPVL